MAAASFRCGRGAGVQQAAQDFRPDYDLTDDGRLTKTASIRLIGNSVCPGAAAAVVGANVAPAPARALEPLAA